MPLRVLIIILMALLTGFHMLFVGSALVRHGASPCWIMHGFIACTNPTERAAYRSFT
jgi:hypothetical protein